MKKIKQTLFKSLSILLIVIMLFGHTVPTIAFADDVVITEPTAPEAPTNPEPVVVNPVAPTTPIAPALPTNPTLPVAPTAPTIPTLPAVPTPVPTQAQNHQNQPSANDISTPTPTPTSAPTSTPTPQTSDSAINTGDANNAGTIITNANNNLSGGGAGSNGGLSTTNSGNGASSHNQSSASVVNNDNTHQNNDANVNNGLTLKTDSGTNNNSANVGNSAINTGDANTSGTIITAVNTNVDGVMVSEFNVADDHIGDIVLDFGAGCVSGCGGNVAAKNTSNGANSTNTANTELTNASSTFQNNDAIVGNDLILTANSGYNDANYNTGGDSAITTGDANVSGNVLTFANNNFAGDVVYGVVNVYGDLKGDIIFPEEQLTACCGGNLAANNTGNGTNSTNTALGAQTNTANTNQNNLANINNDLALGATSGNNDANLNTNGDSFVQTGDTNIDANVLNVANNNLDGGNMWLVLINDAGKWLGRLVGGDGNMAASEGTLLTMDEHGQITASNGGNGAGSTNATSGDVTNTNNTTQNNTANINNNIQLSANTGGNSTNMNTGGNNSIVTGDAQVVLNMVNFVNNNITGGGKIFVTVVNVFGSWVGDFITPGQQKQEKTTTTAANTPGGGVGGSTEAKSETKHAETSKVLGWTGTNPTTPKSETPKPSILGFLTGGTQSEVKVAAVKKANTVGVKGATITTKSKIKVNLAWLILAFPFAILFLMRKRLTKVVNRISALL